MAAWPPRSSLAHHSHLRSIVLARTLPGVFNMAGPIPQVRPSQPIRPSVRRLKPNGAPEWGIEQSAELFQIRGWGAPYFSINEKGHVEVTPDPDNERAIDLYEL